MNVAATIRRCPMQTMSSLAVITDQTPRFRVQPSLYPKLVLVAYINQLSSIFNAISQCSCPQPCKYPILVILPSSDSYSVTVSTAPWPANAYKPPECTVPSKPTDPREIFQKEMKTNTNCMQWYGLSTLLVEIYYEMLNFQVLTESPSYTLVNLIADLGGQLGLFVGMSVISALEMVFLTVLLWCYCSTHKQRKLEMIQFQQDIQKAKDEVDDVEMKTVYHDKGDMYRTEGDPLPPTVAQV